MAASDLIDDAYAFRLEPEDVVVVTCPHYLRIPEDAEELKAGIKRAFPGNKVLVCEGGVNVYKLLVDSEEANA